MRSTDKTKPWLTMDHSECIACKEAGAALYNELETLGVELTGIGVGVSDDNLSPVIHILLMNKNDVAKVPTTFQGYQVRTVVTGVIEAL